MIAVAPRGDYPSLARSRILKPVDDRPVWSVSCLFIDRRHRNKGLSVQMLRAAVARVRQQGGEMVEGYPIDPVKDTVPADGFGSTALQSQGKMLQDAGTDVFTWNFVDVYGMNQDQLVPWNAFLSGQIDAAALTSELQKITDKVANDPSIKKVEVN